MLKYKDFVVRSWQPSDRTAAALLIKTVLAEYGLGWEAHGADIDVLEVENYYKNGEFWEIGRAHV